MERMNGTQVNGSLFQDSISFQCTLQSDDIRLSIFSVCMLSNFVVSLSANTWVLWLISRNTREVLASEIYFLSLAVCEILFCLTLPPHLYCLFSAEAFTYGGGMFFLVRVEYLMLWVGRPIFQSCICVDRYLAVIHPLIYLRLKPLRYRVGKCSLVWCFVFLNLPILPGQQLFGSIWFTLTFCVLLFCSLSVLFSLKRPGPGDNEERRRVDHMKRKAFNIMLINLALFLISYLPALIIQFNFKKNDGIATDLIVNLIVLSGQVQPLLYLHRLGKLSCAQRE